MSEYGIRKTGKSYAYHAVPFLIKKLTISHSFSSCQAILQGHTSLVGQLQMRGDTLVTGGSDGSVRVWSLISNQPIHRLAAHDNSVTSLQFDDARIVSGGSDGRVKIWDTNTGCLIRELSQPAEAVWRVAFESERCVVMASRGSRTIMEVWDFTPPMENSQAEGEDTPIDLRLDSAQQDHSAEEGEERSAQEGDGSAHEEEERSPQGLDQEMADAEEEAVYQERLARMLEDESYSNSDDSEDMTD